MLIAVLRLAEVNDLPQKIELSDAKRQQFIFAPAVRISGFKEARKPHTLNWAFT
jgi:hypothetical protein